MEKYKRILRILFWVYLLFLFIFVGVKFNGSFSELSNRIQRFLAWRDNGDINCNLIPLHSVYVQLTHIHSHWAWWNLLSNILVFIPYGILLPAAYRRCRSFFMTLLFGFVYILAIEVFQFVTMLGVFDVDDILLNTIGVAAGYGVFKICAGIIRHRNVINT